MKALSYLSFAIGLLALFAGLIIAIRMGNLLLFGCMLVSIASLMYSFMKWLYAEKTNL